MIVSAALMLIVTAAVLSAIDRAQATSGLVAAQTTAGNLAQQDQERLRALRIANLANLYEARDVTVKGVQYRVVSTGSFVSDVTQAPGCTSTASANHIRITSSVRSANMRTPIELTSFVNPSVGAFSDATGGLVVKLANAAGGPVPGIDVTISNGATTLRQPTSAEGCAFFAYVPVGTYTASYSAAGYVSQDLVQAVSFPATVSQGTVLSYQKSYDVAFTIAARPATLIGTAEQAGRTEAVTVAHSNLPGTGVRTFPAVSPPALSVSTTGLFPHPSPAFDVYSGGCSANKLPTALLPAGFTASQIAAPGQAYSLKVFEPALIATVTQGTTTGPPVSGATVVMTETQPPAAGCTGRIVQTTDSTGKVADPGIPYSTWTVCAQATQSGTTRSVTLTNQKNDVKAGRAVALALPTSGAASTCA